MRYQIVLSNSAGKLGDVTVVVDDILELTEAAIDFIRDVGSLRNGDTIRIVELED